MTLERLVARCNAQVKTSSLYCRDQELADLPRGEIDMSPRIEDTVFVPHFTKQAKPCFDCLMKVDALQEAK